MCQEVVVDRTAPTTRSAKGTRLNRRGLATRSRMLEVAVGLLSTGGPDAVSANHIAREAGVTWGTIQHQFGDADGVWAAVIEHVSADVDKCFPDPGAGPEAMSLTERIAAIVDTVWRSLERPSARAVHNLRMYLPREVPVLEREFPRTAAALAAWDSAWNEGWNRAFDGLNVPQERLVKVRFLIPTAVRGLHDAASMSTYADINLARQGLVESMACYLS